MDNKLLVKAFSALNPRQAEFVRAYCEQGCVGLADAADKAGFCPKDKDSKDPEVMRQRRQRLSATGAQLIRQPKIKLAIEALNNQVTEQCIVDIQWWIKSCVDLHSKCCQLEAVKERNEEGEMVETGEYRFDSAGASRALDMIGKHLGAYAPVEHKLGIDETLEDVLKTISGKSTGLPNPDE